MEEIWTKLKGKFLTKSGQVHNKKTEEFDVKPTFQVIESLFWFPTLITTRFAILSAGYTCRREILYKKQTVSRKDTHDRGKVRKRPGWRNQEKRNWLTDPMVRRIWKPVTRYDVLVYNYQVKNLEAEPSTLQNLLHSGDIGEPKMHAEAERFSCIIL